MKIIFWLIQDYKARKRGESRRRDPLTGKKATRGRVYASKEVVARENAKRKALPKIQALADSGDIEGAMSMAKKVGAKGTVELEMEVHRSDGRVEYIGKKPVKVVHDKSTITGVEFNDEGRNIKRV